MKFECDSCNAQYMIADEKVGKRGVKVKCKRCSHVIIVRPDGAPAKEARPERDVRVEQAERSKVTPTDAPPNLEATTPGEPAQIRTSPVGLRPVEPPIQPDEPEPELTGPSRPAPVSMMAKDTQLEASDASSEGEVTLAGQPPAHTEQAPPVAEPEKTLLEPAPAVAAAEANEPAALAAPVAPTSPTASPAAKNIGRDSNIGDALDDQLAGAFNQIFEEGSKQAVGKASDDDDDEEQRGPTRILDLEAMNVLRKATATPAVVDGDALDSLRKDLSPDKDDSGGLWDDKKFAQAKAAAPTPKDGGDDGPAAAVWHAAIDDEDVGPLTLAELGRHIEAGGIDRDSLVWKSGMDDWLPAGEVQDVKALFDRVPRPKIAPEEPQRKAPKPSSFDVGSPIDDMLGGSPFDNAPPMMEESDPSWRPHGLTDVYQAANLAEAAGAGGAAGGMVGLIGGSSGSTSRSGASAPPTPAEAEWRPSASSALASLVNDEIDRINKGPLPADDDDLASPRPADDASLSGNLPFSNLMGVELDAGPEVSDSGLRPRGHSQHAAHNGYESSQFGAPSFAPQQPAHAPRPAWFYPGFAGIAFLMLGMASLITYKLVFATPQAPQVVMIGADGRPIQPGMAPVQAGPPEVPAAPVAALPVAALPVAALPVAATPPALPASGGAVPLPAVPAVAVNDGAEKADAKVAVNSAPKVKAKPREAAPEKADPPAPPKEEKKPPASTKGCDPVLDFDCKTTKVEAPKGGKETLEKSDILPVVRDSLAKVKACGQKNKATGAIKMSWKIDKSGKPQDVAVADPKFGGTPVGACVTGVVKAMKFPAYSGKAPPPVSIPLPLQ